ncbi:MAG TPA: FAD-dependent oxidoreductase [Leptospiraceae bacterium]|nr:FAD-dependent oxidoreductase [Leptospiraceae bacterium]
MSGTIVILGGAMAGPTAAARAREINENARIILIEQGTRVSYAACGLSYYLSGEVQSLEDLNHERSDFFRQVYNIEVWTETEAIRLDSIKKILTVKQSKGEMDLSYDSLIFAAGGSSIAPLEIQGVENQTVFRTLDDLVKIRSALDSGKKKFVILGGGPIGLEAADGLIRAGAEVTIVEKGPQILGTFGDKISRVVRGILEISANVITSARDESFEIHEGRITSVTVDGRRIEADYVISAMGIVPRTDILKEAGAGIHSDGTVVINESCATTLKDVYACGVCVSVPHSGSFSWTPQASVADKTAQVAGENAAGGDAKLASFVGSLLLRLPNMSAGRVGPSFRNLGLAAGNRLGRAFVHAYDVEPYMPHAKPLMLELFYEKESGKVLALEAAGSGVERRLDAAAVAIAGSLTIQQLAKLDLAYSPALGTARDALNVAATVAVQAERGRTATVEPADLQARTQDYCIVDTGKKARGSVHLHIPLEELRGKIEEIRSALLKSGARQIACLSETGRRGHLAVRILAAHEIPAVNILGGARLSEF